MGFWLPQMGQGIPLFSASHKRGIVELKENYAHMIPNPTKRNQGVVLCYAWFESCPTIQ